MKHDTLLSTTCGCFIGFIGGVTTEKMLEVMILSFIGGLLGAAGGTLWRMIKNKCTPQKGKDQGKDE